MPYFMKHFYNAKIAATATRPAAKAMGTAISSKIFFILMLGLFLLVSGEGMAQTLFTARQTGAWDDPRTWNATGSAIPGTNDNVLIDRDYTITLSSTQAINSLTIEFKTGNARPALLINGDLTVNHINVNASNNAVNSIATITINGSLIINQTSIWATNGKFSLICGESSTVTYNGATSILPAQIFDINTGGTTTGSYNNLVFANVGTKTATSNIEVKKNLIVRGTAAFSTGSFAHNVIGNLVVENTGANITGNSTISGLGLTVGGNVANSGSITFQTRVLTVGGNFTNNSGATFTAGSGSHTISGNWSNAGTFTAGTGTIILNGVSKSIASSGTGAFNNLTVTNGKSLLSNIRINNSLIVNNTILDTEAHTIELGPNGNILSTENATQHIKGAIETTRSLPANRINSEIFGNIGFRIPAGSENLGDIKVRRVTGAAFVSPLTNNSSVNRQFYVSSTSGAALEALNTAIDMDFPDYDLTGIAPYEIFRVTGAGNMTIDNLKNTSSATGPFGYGVANAQKFGMYTLSSTITPLPVELVSFKAQRHTRGVSLSWATASELDNKGFEVQVSTNSKDFTAIGFVESKVGTTSTRQEYSFLDTKAVSGTRYYRLKQVDLDGTSSYSAIKAVVLDGGSGTVSAYPNPFEDVVIVKLNGTEARNVKVVLVNAQGKAIIEQHQETAGNTITVDMSSLTTKGMYILHVLDNGAKHSFKLMKR